MKIVHSNELPWQAALQQGNFWQRRRPLGGARLTASLFELPPGKKSFPLHRHHITEEALFVVSGHAKVRTTDGEQPVGPGDYVSFPPGGDAHQLVNDGTEPCVYLGLSAGGDHDIVEYPDSGKIAARTGPFPTGKRVMFREKDQVAYLDGEQ